MIGVVDYRMGNLGSVMNALKFIQADAKLIRDPDELADCTAVVFPGQGAFRDCMTHLEDAGFVPALKTWIDEDKPFMGICMGLQLLFEDSEESPGKAGLGIFPGRVTRFPRSELKVPQMGWNRVHVLDDKCPVFKDIPDNSHFYFVHSYYVPYVEQDWALGVTDYGLPYTAALWRDNLFAAQYHPEKSQDMGIRMLRNFNDWVSNEAGV
jgi:glutamine amidotransferase